MGPQAEPDLAIYTVNEWTEFLWTDDGWNSVDAATMLHANCAEAIFSMAKGKGGKGKEGGGKGKGGGAATGKGGFQGMCWQCNVYGHSGRNCPTNPYTGGGKGAQQKGAGKGKGLHAVEPQTPASTGGFSFSGLGCIMSAPAPCADGFRAPKKTVKPVATPSSRPNGKGGTRFMPLAECDDPCCAPAGYLDPETKTLDVKFTDEAAVQWCRDNFGHLLPAYLRNPSQTPTAKWEEREPTPTMTSELEFPKIIKKKASSKVRGKFNILSKMTQKQVNAAKKKEAERRDEKWFMNTKLEVIWGYEAEDPIADQDKSKGEDEPKPVPETKTTAPTSVPKSLTEIFAEKLKDRFRTNHDINLFTECPAGQSLIAAVEEKVWNKIAVAVDSGACAHVTPGNVCSIDNQPKIPSAPENYYGAGNEAIKNLGSQKVNGQDEKGQNVGFTFDVAENLSRPLASVYEITEQGNKVVFEKGGGYIQCGKTGSKIQLRPEGKLYFLDLWVEVPKSISGSPFARPI